MSDASVGSILVCRLSALGDVVLSQAVAAALAERYPQATRTFLSREPYGRILAGNPAVGELALWAGAGHPLPESVRARRWDVVCDLSGSGRSRRLLAAVSAGRVLRVRKQTWQRFAFVRLRRVGGARVSLEPAIDRLFTTVAPLGIERGGRVPFLAERDDSAADVVVVAPGAGRETKRWDEARFAEVAERLVASGKRVVVVAATHEREIAEAVVRDLDPRRAVLSLHDDPSGLPAIVRAAGVALTNDSGLMHVAEACGVPVVAIFGPTHPRLGFAPLRADSVVLHTGIECSPCDIHGPARCPKGHHRCMTEISVDRVLGEVEHRVAQGAHPWPR